jgi:antitoxin StbD
MSNQILSATAASITELKRNPMGTLKKGNGSAVAILDRNEPAFYCVPPNSLPTMSSWSKTPSLTG